MSVHPSTCLISTPTRLKKLNKIKQTLDNTVHIFMCFSWLVKMFRAFYTNRWVIPGPPTAKNWHQPQIPWIHISIWHPSLNKIKHRRGHYIHTALRTFWIKMTYLVHILHNTYLLHDKLHFEKFHIINFNTQNGEGYCKHAPFCLW